MKHGDMYTAEDGRELMAVTCNDNSCDPSDLPFECTLDHICEFEDRPCRSRAIIFVNKEKYLTYKLLGTAQSSG